MPKPPPFRPLHTRPNISPRRFDPNQQVFIPELSVTNRQIHDVSPNKVRLIGIKIYDDGGNNTGVLDDTDTEVTFDTVEFSQDFLAPTGSTFKAVNVPLDGVYTINAITQWDTTGVNLDANLRLLVNGNQQEGESARTNAVKNRRVLAVTRTLEAGDNLKLQVRQVSGGNRDLNTGSYNCAMSVLFIGAI